MTISILITSISTCYQYFKYFLSLIRVLGSTSLHVPTKRGISLDHNTLGQNMSLKHVIVHYAATDNKEIRNLNRTIFTRSPVNDMVSKNITLVLENLLKDYENSQLPTHGKGKSCKNIHIGTHCILGPCTLYFLHYLCPFFYIT